MLLSATVCLLAAILGVCTEPVIRHEFQQIQFPSSGEVRCDFGTPIIDCKIRVSDYFDGSFDAVLDLAAGAQSQSVAVHSHLNVSYAGAGLLKGECGVKMAATGYFIVLVECFGQTADRQWSRGFGLLMSHEYEELPVTVPTRRLIAAQPVSEVSLLLKARGALTQCSIKTPAMERVDLTPGNSLPSGSRYRLHGAGMSNGECGFTLPNVQPSDAGVWNWWGDQGNSVTWQATVVLVLAAPVGEPTLEVLEPATLRAGSQLSATCRAPSSVPPAKVTWLLGGEEVRRDDFNMTSLGDVAKSHVWESQSVVQTLTRVLQDEDFGKRLECRIDHPALAASKTVALQLPGPVPDVNVTAESSLVRTAVGHLTEMACVVESVEAATVQWRRAGVPVQQSSMVHMGHDGARHWLHLEDTTAEDLVNFSCSSGSVTRHVQVTGLPGTPVWTGNATHVAWRVESPAPLVGARLRARRGKGKLQDFTDLELTEVDESWHLVSIKRLPVAPGAYTLYLEAKNEFGWSATSPYQKITLVALEVRAESAVVHTAEGLRSEMACEVNVLDATVQWSRATGVPVQESILVVKGSDGSRHWLVLEDPNSADLAEFTCTASKAGSSASQVVRLTGLPGAPEWTGNASHLAWRVKSGSPLTGFRLKIRQVDEKWQQFTDLDASKAAKGWQLVTAKRLPVPAGSYSAFLKVRNGLGWSELSPIHNVTLGTWPASR